jgi:hypothetical protein
LDFQHASGRRATAQALVNEQTHSAVACRERKVTGGDAAVVITMVVTGKDDVDDDWDVSGKREKGSYILCMVAKSIPLFIAGWWFGTFFIFPHIGNNSPGPN